MIQSLILILIQSLHELCTFILESLLGMRVLNISANSFITHARMLVKASCKVTCYCLASHTLLRTQEGVACETIVVLSMDIACSRNSSGYICMYMYFHVHKNKQTTSALQP